MNEHEAISAGPFGCVVRTWVVMLTTVFLLGAPLSALGAEGTSEGLAEQYPAVVQRLTSCIQAKGDEYFRARAGLLGLGEAELRAALAEEHLTYMQWNARLVGGIIRAWTEDAGACKAFHELFDACIRSSYGTQTGDPSARRITGCCVREWDKGHHPEMLILERLFKYEDPPHVKEGIIIALGAKGSVQSLSALRGLMSSTDDIDLSFHCVLAVGKLCRKLRDAAPVPDLVHLYKTTERPSMENVPEELKGKVPPPFQRQVVSALRQMASAEALQALDDLNETETDRVLLQIIDDARNAMRAEVKSDDE